jgi:hypothetical protein
MNTEVYMGLWNRKNNNIKADWRKKCNWSWFELKVNKWLYVIKLLSIFELKKIV